MFLYCDRLQNATLPPPGYPHPCPWNLWILPYMAEGFAGVIKSIILLLEDYPELSGCTLIITGS